MSGRNINTQRLVAVSLCIATQIILARFFSIQTPYLRISFGYIPMAICSITFGPVTGGIAAAIADFLGVMLFPAGGAYFPGFTLTAFLAGAAYGFITKVMGISPISFLISAMTVCIVIHLVIDTYWIKLAMGQGYFALLPARAIKNFIMVPIQAITVASVWKLVEAYLVRFRTT